MKVPVLEEMDRTREFVSELEALINKYSWDAKCNMPDFILADYVVFTLSALCNAHNRTREWGKVPEIQAVTPTPAPSPTE